MERPKKLGHRRRKKKATSSETIEEGHDAGKGRDVERITADERRNEPRPDTERDFQDEDVDRDEGEGDGGDYICCVSLPYPLLTQTVPTNSFIFCLTS
ncbi:hypothetical protein Bca4012_097309 [Brassica carinata]